MKQINQLKIWLLVILCLARSSATWGQILTFEFSSLTGSEISAISNTNDVNLHTSTIVRGSGLTASANGGRFNATNWALTSIANAVTENQYMEFTISPKEGYQFSVSSIYVQWQRSNTGNTKISLRSSVDNYASDLDVVKDVTDNTSTQAFTWTFTQLNSTNPVTYRLYSYAEATTGSGGPGDGVGNDIVVNGSVTSTATVSPTLTAAIDVTVDAPFDITFTEDAAWRGAITSVSVGGTLLDPLAYDATSAGKITFTPSASLLLQTPGTKSIVIAATGYTNATVSQTINVGTPVKLAVKTQPAAPTTNGGVLAAQPEVYIQDQYGNTTTSTASVSAFVGNDGTWTLGGTTAVDAVSGTATFTNLTATSTGSVTDATINFTSGALTSAISTGFDIPAPVPQFEWVNLQWPGTGTVKLGQSYEVYVQAFKDGVTNAAGQGAGVQAWIGYSTENTDPGTWTNWIVASYNQDAGNNDEYKADLGSAIIAEGTYYYASRFQLETGLYVYGGFNGGFWDGTTNVSGTLTVNPAETLDWVNLQSPATGNITTAQTLDVYAQVFETDLTEAAGQGAGVTAWIGYSTTNTNPNTWTNWIEATFNTQVGNNDEYKATLSGLAAGTYYYASRFKYGLADYQYGGLTGTWANDQSGVLVVTTAEPANHVTDFTVNAENPTYSSLKLNWTDVAEAEGYLIKGSPISYEDISVPVDGVPETDGTLVKNVTAEIETYTFTELADETTYYFKIFPYNGSGANVNFKTDGTVPQATASTTKTPTLLLVEDFEYTVGTELTMNNWNITGSTATPTVKVEASSITYPGYLSSGIGNETLLSASGGQDVNRIFTAQTSGTIYASCLVNVTSATTTGDYFFHLGPSTLGSTYKGRVFVKKDASNNLYFGVAHSGTPVYSSTPYVLNTTYLVVLKYDFISGTANDAAAIIINPVLNAGEPLTSWLVNTDTPSDPVNIGTVALRQGSASNAANVKLDGVRVSTRWADIVGEIPTFSGIGEWTETARWNTGVVPGASIPVIVDGNATINSNVEVAGITINSGKSLTINSQKQLTVSEALTNYGTLTVEDGATVKTYGTVAGSGATYAKIHLTGSPDNSARQWWYVSSPVSNAQSGVFDPEGTNNLGYFDETLLTPNYVQILNNTASLEIGKGYLFQNKTTATYAFTGGNLNTGDVTLNLTRTGNSAGQRGFHIVGNPYPSFLDWNAAFKAETTSNIRNTIWYRTTSGSANGMQFLTYNADTEVGTGGVTGVVPPMQGFWMKVHADNNDGVIQFTNDMRSHSSESSNPRKAPAIGKKQLLRLQVSNGVVSDETILVGISGATDSFDKFDSEKMVNNSADIPELYTSIGSQDIVINSINALTSGKQFALGFRPGKAGNFSIEATQLENIDSKVILIDRLNNSETELQEGVVYSFSSEATATSSRFSIEFRAPGITSVEEVTSSNTRVYVTSARRIAVESAALTRSDRISVYSLAGEHLLSQEAEGAVTVLSPSFAAGVYLVKVKDHVQKIIVNY